MATYYQERENGYPPVGTPGLPVTINPDQDQHFVVAAIDFGTTYSGYAFAFKRDPDSVHMMRRWEGGDPGVTNMKVCVVCQLSTSYYSLNTLYQTLTTLLLKPNGEFHSFGFGARDFYHDLEDNEAKKWLYFEKFKMTLHSSQVCVTFLTCLY